MKMIDTKEKREKAIEVMKREGTYLTYLRWKKRGADKKMADMIEDVFNRHGQNLDGDLDFKHNDEEKVVLR